MRAIDMHSREFGRLTVLERAVPRSTRAGRALWLCLCRCGVPTHVAGVHLRDGNTKSCGCLQREKARLAATVVAQKEIG